MNWILNFMESSIVNVILIKYFEIYRPLVQSGICNNNLGQTFHNRNVTAYERTLSVKIDEQQSRIQLVTNRA